MNIKPLLLALAIGVVPMASDAKDWSKEPLVAVRGGIDLSPDGGSVQPKGL